MRLSAGESHSMVSAVTRCTTCEMSLLSANHHTLSYFLNILQLHRSKNSMQVINEIALLTSVKIDSNSASQFPISAPP